MFSLENKTCYYAMLLYAMLLWKCIHKGTLGMRVEEVVTNTWLRDNIYIAQIC